MVAYSPTFCLPCFESADSPCVNTGTACEPSTVWCDLVSIVEGVLNPIDAVLSRTATAIPLASVTGVSPLGQVSPLPVVFNTVEYDTDGMVNLDLNPTIVTPRRNGVYMAYGHLLTKSVPVTTDGVEEKLIITSGATTSVGATPQVSVLTGHQRISTQKLFPWRVGVNQPFSLSYEGSQGLFTRARLSVWWVCDL